MKPKRKLNENVEVINKRRIRRKIESSSSSSDSDSDYIPSQSRSQSIESSGSIESLERSEKSDESDSSQTGNISSSSTSSDDDSSTEFINSKTVKTLKIKDPVLYSKFEKVFQEVKNNEPDIIDIVSKKLQLKDKVKLFHLFEIYKNSHPQTHDWFDTRTSINKKLKEAIRNQAEYDRYSSEEHQTMENQITQLEKNISNNMLQIKYKILKLETNEENKKNIYQKFIELQSTNKDDSEYSKLLNWVTNAIELPFDKIKIFSFKNSMTNFLRIAYEKMEKELFGMKKVKEQLLFFINAKLTNPNMKRTNLGLIGHPGVGKTSIARLLSTILDIGFQQISCGGIDRSDFFKGHDYTYIGSRSGEIANCLKRMGTKNGILFFDEYEKVVSNKSISALMLHITDPSQNSEFRDNYFNELTIDLSHIWFIYSMNTMPSDEALRDRIFYIDVQGYKFNEKISIVKEYILKKTLINSGLRDTDIVLDIDSIKHLINVCSKNDKGVRNLEKVIMDMVNKFKFLELHQDDDGNLPFDLSFKVDRKITFPLTVNTDMLKTVIQIDQPIDNVLTSLYI
jgi:ATP-dependent Lon protease